MMIRNRILHSAFMTYCLLQLSSVCTGQQLGSNLDFLLEAINVDDDNIVTQTEVDTYFSTFGGVNEVTRCQFQLALTKDGGRPIAASALFEILQEKTGSGRTLRSSEFRQGILGAQPNIGILAVEQNVDDLEKKIRSSLEKPYQTDYGPSAVQYTEFEVGKWASESDSNSDLEISTAELSATMRSFDTNNDFGILRCEFVDGMTSRFRQHPLVATNMFDLLFKSQEITWADVDTDFLLKAIDSHSRGRVTTGQFIEYMTGLNKIAAGVEPPQSTTSNSTGASDGSTPLTIGPLCWLITGVFTYRAVSRR